MGVRFNRSPTPPHRYSNNFVTSEKVEVVIEAEPNDDALEIDVSRRSVADRSRPGEAVDAVGEAGIRDGRPAGTHGELARGRNWDCDRVYRRAAKLKAVPKRTDMALLLTVAPDYEPDSPVREPKMPAKCMQSVHCSQAQNIRPVLLFSHAMRMSALGQKQTLKRPHPMSALPPNSGHAQRDQGLRFVPKADILRLFDHLVGASSDSCACSRVVTVDKQAS
jgi:hypothetical protein